MVRKEGESDQLVRFSGENETGLDESVEEGCSSLEPLSQEDCSSECSAACFRHVKSQLDPTVSLMVGLDLIPYQP